MSLPSTLLFCPGTRLERVAKALATGTQHLIIDLEDAVAAGSKDAARTATLEFLRTQPRSARPPGGCLALRINRLVTAHGVADVHALVNTLDAAAMPDIIVLPKVESPFELRMLARLLQDRGHPRLIALIESAEGLEQVGAISMATPQLAALGFGGADLAADLSAAFAWEPLLWARSRVVQAAARAGIAALDVPSLNLDDDAGLQAECERARALGFHGKFAIHPRQLAVIRAAFLPSAAQLDFARRVIAAYHAAGGQVCELDGGMVEEPVYRSAQRTLARAGEAPQ